VFGLDGSRFALIGLPSTFGVTSCLWGSNVPTGPAFPPFLFVICLAMSQSSSFSSTILFATLQYEKALDELDVLHNSLSQVSDKISAWAWVVQFGKTMMRPNFFGGLEYVDFSYSEVSPLLQWLPIPTL
jgi:hypothetical protein